MTNLSLRLYNDLLDEVLIPPQIHVVDVTKRHPELSLSRVILNACPQGGYSQRQADL